VSNFPNDPLDLFENKDKILKALVRLGWQCIHPSKEEVSRPSRMLFRLNKYPRPDGQDIFYSPSLEASRTFEEVKQLLKKEPHVKRKKRCIGKIEEMHDEVRDYCRTIINSKERIKSQNDVKSMAQDFLLSLTLSDMEWLLVSPISGLSLENERISISDSDIMRFDLGYITNYTDKVKRDDLTRIIPPWNGVVCIFVYVKAIDSDGAIEKGEKKINLILCMIRGYFRTHTFYSLPTPTEFVVISKETGEVRTLSRYDIESQCHIDSGNEKELLDQVSDLSNFLKGVMPPKMTKAMLRALRWLGSSVQDKELEDKLVKCFFALETLLTPGKGDRQKGQPLAFRLSLLELRVLGDFYQDPDPLYQLYRKRSIIAHGGDIEKDAVTKEDIRYLEIRVWRVILYVADAVVTANQGEISSTHKLVSWIERKDDRMEEIKKFISEFCDKELEDYVNPPAK
jgi:hypothetical protein